MKIYVKKTDYNSFFFDISSPIGVECRVCDHNNFLCQLNDQVFRGCLWQPLYCFHFHFRYVTLVRYIYIYIYIICVPTRNRNNGFILEFILREIKMADFER